MLPSSAIVTQHSRKQPPASRQDNSNTRLPSMSSAPLAAPWRIRADNPKGLIVQHPEPVTPGSAQLLFARLAFGQAQGIRVAVADEGTPGQGLRVLAFDRQLSLP